MTDIAAVNIVDVEPDWADLEDDAIPATSPLAVMSPGGEDDRVVWGA